MVSPSGTARGYGAGATDTHVGTATRPVLRRALAVLIAVALLSGIVAVAVKDGTQDPSPSWDERVAPIAEFVEQTRGLEFRHPVPVDFLPRAAFRARLGQLRAMTLKDRREFDHSISALRAVGLIRPGIDAADAMDRLADRQVIGVYDDESGRIAVRGAAFTPHVRVVLAHELTHALQDQHFDLHRLDDLNGAPALAATTLVEGDAVRVELAYAVQLSAADRERFLASALAGMKAAVDQPDIPDVLRHASQFPYAFGPTFAEAVARDGGNAALDRALTRLPRSEAEIVNPQRYLSRTPLAAVDPPAMREGEQRIWAPGELGQASLLEVLGNAVGYTDAWKAVRRWRGDQWVLYRRGASACVAIAVALERPTDAEAFTVVARRWAATLPGATVAPTGLVVQLRSCEPSPGAAAVRPPAAAPWDVLAARSGLMLVAMRTRAAAPATAACAADRVIQQLGHERTARLMEAEVPADLLASVPELVGDATTACSRRRPTTLSDLIA